MIINSKKVSRVVSGAVITGILLGSGCVTEACVNNCTEKTTDIAAKEQVTNLAQTKKNSNLYVNNKYGFSLKFPKTWSGKYRLEETNGGINVYMADKYIGEGENGWLFTIEEVNKDNANDGDFLDSIYGIPKVMDINGHSFWVAGPTGITIHPESKYFSLYEKMMQERYQVLKTLKAK